MKGTTARFLASLTVALVLLGTTASAAVAAPSGTRLWVRRYPYPVPKDQAFFDCTVDRFGNMYAVGATDRGAPGVSDYDALIVKYSPTGARLWSRVYAGVGLGGSDVARSVAVDSAGQPHVAIDSASATDQKSDFVVAKWSTSGVLLWARRYNGAADESDMPADIAVDNAGNAIVTGQTDVNAGTHTSNDMVTVKYNAAGTYQWADIYAGPAGMDDEGVSLVVDSAQRICVAGSSQAGASNSDWVVRKLRGGGSLMWAKRYNASANGNDAPRAIKIDSRANVYACGGAKFTGHGMSDYAIIKWSPGGVFRWIRYYDNPAAIDHDVAMSMVSHRDVILVTGVSADSSMVYDVVTLKFLPDGRRVWARRYDGPAHRSDIGYAVAGGSNGAVYVTGSSLTDPGRGDDMLTLKYTSSGSLAWVRRYDCGGSEGDMGYAARATSSSLYVAGYGYLGAPPNSQSDGLVIRYQP